MSCTPYNALCLVQTIWCLLYGQTVWCKLCGAIYEVGAVRCNMFRDMSVLQLTGATNELPSPWLAETSHPLTSILSCKTHAAVIVVTAWRWLERLCGRAGARKLADGAVSWFDTADMAAMALTDGNVRAHLKSRTGAR
eukprot:5296500-Pyramimonas_sp.AAC.1